MISDSGRIGVARKRLLLVAGSFGWLGFGGAVIWHIVTGWSSAHPPIWWLLDWHVHYVGAIDLMERDLYRTPLHLAGWPLPAPVFNLPPGSAAIAIPLLPFGREIGGIVWLVSGIVALIFAALLVTRLARIELGWAWVGLAFLGYTGVYYFVGHVTLGNVNHIMLALLVAFAWAHLKEHQRLSGILLGTAIAIKAWPVALGVLLIREQRWQEVRWVTGVVVAQGILVLAWMGADVLPDMVRALRTNVPLPPDAAFLWTTWLREVVSVPPWFAPVVALLLLLIPARGRLGLGLGLLGGLTLINNIWDHYLPTFAVSATLIASDLIRSVRDWQSGDGRLSRSRLSERDTVPKRAVDSSERREL